MRQVIAIVTGVSGVGKSWLLQRVVADVPAQVLSAGRLIAEEMSQQAVESDSYDELRAGDIGENQKALVAGFRRKLDQDKPIVLLDAHVVIDTPTGLEIIPSAVFADIDPSMFVFIEDDPVQILRHRSADPSRRRPQRDLATLTEQQAKAKSVAKNIASALAIPCHILMAGNVEGFVHLLQVRGRRPHV